jgi:hypothetical protein
MGATRLQVGKAHTAEPRGSSQPRAVGGQPHQQSSSRISEPYFAASALHDSEGWKINAKALADPKRLDYYFAVFSDRSGRKLTAVRQATKFKGTFKGHSLSVVDDTLQLVADHLFKLDEFSFGSR